MKVFSFTGADHKAGTTLLSECAAERLAARFPGLRVLHVCACGWDERPAGEPLRENLDSLRTGLKDGVLDAAWTAENSAAPGSLFRIGGSCDPCSGSSFHPDMISYLIARMRDHFDLIICDAGCEPAHGISLGALLGAELVVMVLTQSETSVRRLEWLRPLCGRLGIEPGLFVINRYSRGSVYGRRYLCERLGIGEDSALCVREASYHAEGLPEEDAPRKLKDRAFLKDVDALCSRMAEAAGLFGPGR